MGSFVMDSCIESKWDNPFKFMAVQGTGTWFEV